MLFDDAVAQHVSHVKDLLMDSVVRHNVRLAYGRLSIQKALRVEL